MLKQLFLGAFLWLSLAIIVAPLLAIVAIPLCRWIGLRVPLRFIVLIALPTGFVFQAFLAWALSDGVIQGAILGVPLRSFIGAMSAVPLAYGLYLLRRWRKDIYGIIEVATGFGTILIAAAGTFAAATLIALLGGVYVIIRGLTNIEDADRPAHVKPIREPYAPPPPRYRGPRSRAAFSR